MEQIRTVIKTTKEHLESLGEAAKTLDIGTFFLKYNQILDLFTDEEVKKKYGPQATIPPWSVPGENVQRIMIHCQLILITKALQEAGVFNVAARKVAAQSSKIVGLDGMPANHG